MRLVIGLLFLCAAASGQDAVLSLDNWKVRAGDDPQWAGSDFDDRGWADGQLPRIQAEGFRWYRTRVSIPAEWSERPLALGFGPMAEVFEVYVNGIRAGGLGELEPQPVSRFVRHLAIVIPPGMIAGKEITVAVRRWMGRGTPYIGPMAVPGNGSFPHAPQIGTSDLIETREQGHRLAAERSTEFSRLLAISLAAMGLFCLQLYRERRDRREYLWLGLALASVGVTAMVLVAAVRFDLPVRSFVVSLLILINLMNRPCLMLFLRHVCPPARRMLGWVAGVLSLITFWSSLAIWLNLEGRPAAFLAWVAIEILTLLVTAFLLVRSRQKQALALAAAILLVPLAAFVPIVRGFADFVWQGYALDFPLVAVVVFALTTSTIFYQRFQEQQREQSAREEELAAGRRAQRLLLESSADPDHLFQVEKAYLPAREVGGDFYQTVTLKDGGLLVVVGDVSGKGLDAAMRGATLLGALRTLQTLPPGLMLTRLNDVFCDGKQSGFVTCCCARFDSNGSVTLANAGHPSPYRDGCELELEAGLPLGILTAVEYGESTAQGERFAFVSDGVIEAENPQRELFGFDRTREISGKSATEIAEAAKAWGQTDDITVVTVRRAP